MDLTDNLTPDGAAFLLERAKGGFGLVIQTAAWADMEVEGLGCGIGKKDFGRLSAVRASIGEAL